MRRRPVLWLKSGWGRMGSQAPALPVILGGRRAGQSGCASTPELLQGVPLSSRCGGGWVCVGPIPGCRGLCAGLFPPHICFCAPVPVAEGVRAPQAEPGGEAPAELAETPCGNLGGRSPGEGGLGAEPQGGHHGAASGEGPGHRAGAERESLPRPVTQAIPLLILVTPHWKGHRM